MILQNIWRRVVGNVLINISPSNIFPNMLLPQRFHLHCQAVMDAVSINGLICIVLTSQAPLKISGPHIPGVPKSSPSYAIGHWNGHCWDWWDIFGVIGFGETIFQYNERNNYDSRNMAQWRVLFCLALSTNDNQYFCVCQASITKTHLR